VHLDLGTALSESVLGLLAGDFGFTIASGTAFHFEASREAITARTGTEETWLVRIRGAYFTAGNGSRIRTLQKGLFPLLVCAVAFNDSIIDGTNIHFTSGVGDEDQFVLGQTMLPLLLNFTANAEQAIHWRTELRSQRLKLTARDLLTAAKTAIGGGVVRVVISPRPRHVPSFLAESAS
jgi:hypothetical protein